MSLAEVVTEPHARKSRKRNIDAAEIEIDVDAPEPPSKKALRKAKKTTVEDNSPAKGSETKPASSQQHESQVDNRRSEYGIWIGNLSFGTTRDDLLKFMTANSTQTIHEKQITRIHLPQGQPKFGKPSNKGFAYVDFSDVDSLKSALELSEALLDGRRVLIKDAKNFAGRPEKKTDEKEVPGKAPSKRMFIGNLDFDTTAEELEEHFGVCGTILNTHMATFEDSGKCKGFAWVEFEQLSSAEAAMRGWVEQRAADQGPSSNESSGRRRIWLQKLRGRKLRMEFAEDKATRYQKRFGKGSKTNDGEDAGQEEAIQEVQEDSKPKRTMPTKFKDNRRARSGGKYAEETVQRLTGAIVEGKGQKVVFE